MKQNDDNSEMAVLSAANWLQHLPPGPLAELRRMKPATPAPLFWRLTARFPKSIGRKNRESEWIAIIRMLAILTERGDPESRNPVHDSKRRLGAVLCDGGDPSWPQKAGVPPQPALNERRLAQLMAARGVQRAVHLERAIRTIATSRTSGVNVTDIATSVLNPQFTRSLAETYYHRLDRAEQAAKEIEEGKS